MKFIKRNTIIATIIIIFTVTILGCNKDDKDIIEKEKIDILKGAIVEDTNEGYKNLNLINGSYSNSANAAGVVLYDYKSGVYLYNKSGILFVDYNGKEFEVKDKNIVSALLSPGGRYLSYFTNDSYYELKLIDLTSGEELSVNSDVSISGTVLCWLDNKTMVYYGVNSQDLNGIYLYDVEEKKETLIHRIDVGYIELIKTYEDGAIFIEQNIDNNKIIKTINRELEVTDISQEFITVKDLVITNKGVFILGKVKDDTFSVYEIIGDKIRKLVYDFPMYINIEKGLSSDENGNPLFIGKDSPSGELGIYTFDGDYVKKIYTTKLDISFIEVN